MRCGPTLTNSSGEYGPKVAAVEGSEADFTDAVGRAALSAAEEVVTRNSLRVGLSECGMSIPPEGRSPWKSKDQEDFQKLTFRNVATAEPVPSAQLPGSKFEIGGNFSRTAS